MYELGHVAAENSARIILLKVGANLKIKDF